VSEHAHETAPAPPAAAPAAAVPAPALGGGIGAVLALQRSAGNQATLRALSAGGGPLLARDDKSVAVSAIALSKDRSSIPGDGTITATATPSNATGVTFSAEKNTADPAGTTVDSAKGTVSVGDSQEGGLVNIKATSDEGSFVFAPLMVSEKPTTLASTSASAGSQTGRYAGEFVHTFTGKSGDKTKLEGANINEKFDPLSVESPFGTFTVTANAAGSQGWDLDASGAMAGPDKVSIDKSMIDARKFVKSASNPSPAKTLPQSFSMAQQLRAKTWPSGTLDGSPFTTTNHTRGLEEQSGTLAVVIGAGKDSVTLDYEGPPVYRGISASSTKVVASKPKPKEKDATWEREEVTVTAEVLPSTAKLVYSLQGEKLGCEIDASSGVVKIGSTAGTIKVRASDGGTGHYDEVSIEITERPKDDAAKQAEEGGSAEPSLAVPTE
jgi:hypothetical protein